MMTAAWRVGDEVSSSHGQEPVPQEVSSKPGEAEGAPQGKWSHFHRTEVLLWGALLQLRHFFWVQIGHFLLPV